MATGSAVATDGTVAHVYRPGSALKHKGRFVALRGSPFNLIHSARDEYDDFDKQYTLSATFVLDSGTAAACNVLRLEGDNTEVQIDAAASTFTVMGGGGKTDPIAYLQDGSFKERHVLQVTRDGEAVSVYLNGQSAGGLASLGFVNANAGSGILLGAASGLFPSRTAACGATTAAVRLYNYRMGPQAVKVRVENPPCAATLPLIPLPLVLYPCLMCT